MSLTRRPIPMSPATSTAVPHQKIVTLTTLIMTAWLVAEIASVMVLLEGHFVYTLDDAYIHLSLANQIVQGHYGLTPGVAAAPSSSIFYPFLLVPILAVGLAQWAPMLVNALATMANAALLAWLMVNAAPELARTRVYAFTCFVVLVALGLNLVGVAMTGMEHSLQVALTLAWLLGASRFLRCGELASWWWLCAALQPFVRYEGATLWLATVVLLAFRRRPRAALGLLVVGSAGLATFSLFLHAQGLPWLPSSVLVKSGQFDSIALQGQVGPALHIVFRVSDNILQHQGKLLLAAMLGLALVVVRKASSADPRDQEAKILCLVALAVSTAQLVFGQVDGFSRYSVYALSLDSVMLLTGFSAEIRSVMLLMGRRRWSAAGGAVVTFVLVSRLFYVDAHRSLRADMAARNIYEQQYQMHRLVTDFYRAPVAVNDLGMVSFGNPNFVLDLWGLGSEEARVARLGDPSGRWMMSLAERHGVGLAMIYDTWFRHVPAEWVQRASLRLAGPRESSAESVVELYATAPERVAAVDAAIDGWGTSLPTGVRLDRVAAAPSSSASR